MIEKCAEFKIWRDPRITGVRDIQICGAVGNGGVECGGFSGNCHVAELFKSVSGRSREDTTFPDDTQMRKVYHLSGTRIYWKRRITPTHLPWILTSVA